MAQFNQIVAQLQAEELALDRSIENKTAFIDNTNRTIAEREAAHELLNKRVRELREDIHSLTGLKTGAEQEEATLDAALSEVEAAVVMLREKLDDLIAANKKMEDEADEAVKQFANKYTTLGVALDSAHYQQQRNGQQHDATNDTEMDEVLMESCNEEPRSFSLVA